MSKIKLLTIAVISLMILNVAVIAFSIFRRPPHPPGGHERPREIIISRLHFDQEQIRQYDNLINVHRTTIKMWDDSIRETKTLLYKTLDSDADTVKNALLDKLSLFQREIEHTHYNHFAEIRKLCKPEQLSAYKELVSELADIFAPKKNGHPPKD